MPTIGQRRSTPLSVIDWKTTLFGRSLKTSAEPNIEKFIPGELRSEIAFPPRTKSPRARNAHFAIAEYHSPRVRLYPCLSYTESFGNFLDRENRTEINRQIQFIRFTTNSTITCSGRLLLGRTRYCTSSIRRITHARANARAVRVKGVRVARGKGGVQFEAILLFECIGGVRVSGFFSSFFLPRNRNKDGVWSARRKGREIGARTNWNIIAEIRARLDSTSTTTTLHWRPANPIFIDRFTIRLTDSFWT